MRIQPTAAQRAEMPSEAGKPTSFSDDAVARSSGTESSSEDVVSLKSLAVQTMQLPELRQEKVQKLKAEIASGKYYVDPKEVADAILKG